MTILKTLNHELDKLHLLHHPFYQAWSEGKLSIDILKYYATQYYHHVASFPRYLSMIHSSCENINYRQILLDNLIDEEKGEENHPELWLRFAESLGCIRQEVTESQLNKNTTELIQGYFNIAKTSFSHGIGSLYSYERQTPEIAKSKIDGLKKYYDISDERGLKFFVEHISADEWHSAECLSIIEDLPEKDQELASVGALTGAKLLWHFLDEVYSITSV